MAREITIIAVAGFELQALHYYELIPGTAVFEGIMYTWYQVLLLLYTLRGQECGPYQPSMNTITGDHVKQDLPTVSTKTYTFRYFYQQYLVLFTMYGPPQYYSCYYLILQQQCYYHDRRGRAAAGNRCE